jgi:hypothetical protein
LVEEASGLDAWVTGESPAVWMPTALLIDDGETLAQVFGFSVQYRRHRLLFYLSGTVPNQSGE